jgi:hypothetical protein
MQLELTQTELKWLLANPSKLGTQTKGPNPHDMSVDEVGYGLFNKLLELAKTQGIDFEQ